MWAKKNKNRSISGPSLIGTSGGSLAPDASSKSPVPPKNISKDLPALPSEATVTSGAPSRNDAETTHTPLSPIRDYQEYSRYAEDPDISPPDSPIDVTGTQRYSIHDVSPIDNDGGHFFTDPPTKKPSQIPVPRRHSQGALLHGNVPGSSATPAMRKESTQQEATVSTSLLQPVKQRSKQNQASHLLHSGKEKLQIFSKTREPKERQPQQFREQWKGASGRTPLMTPIESNEKDRSRSQSPHVGQNFSNYGRDTYMVTTITAGNPMEEKHPKKVRHFKPNISSLSLSKEASPDTSAKPSLTSTVRRASPDQAEGSGDRTPTNDKKEFIPSNSNHLSTMFEDLNLIDEPKSRFSSSTYAPTEIATTPPGSAGSDTPPVPAIPTSPIMTRRRPVPSSAASIKSTKRKPVGSETPPPEVDLKDMTPHDRAQYRINSFQARCNELSKRKASVKTMLHELTQVIQPSSIAYDMATRDEVKKSVVSLKNELDEITKEEHDLGVKLSRAYRKLDNADSYEHSTLWVKSITS